MSEKTAKAKRIKARAGLVKIKCMFQPCTIPVMVKAPPEGVEVGTPQHMTTMGGIPMCPRHADMLNFYVWATTSIKLQPQQTKGGIIVPGHQQFDPTLKGAPGGP